MEEGDRMEKPACSRRSRKGMPRIEQYVSPGTEPVVTQFEELT